MARIDLEALGREVAERLEGIPLTPSERAEALCIALGVGCELSAVASGVSPETVRARRRRILRKLEQARS